MAHHSRAFTGFVEDLRLFSQDQNGSFQPSVTPVLEPPSPPDLWGHMLHTNSHSDSRRYIHKTHNFIFFYNFIFLKKPVIWFVAHCILLRECSPSPWFLYQERFCNSWSYSLIYLSPLSGWPTGHSCQKDPLQMLGGNDVGFQMRVKTLCAPCYFGLYGFLEFWWRLRSQEVIWICRGRWDVSRNMNRKVGLQLDFGHKVVCLQIPNLFLCILKFLLWALLEFSPQFAITTSWPSVSSLGVIKPLN